MKLLRVLQDRTYEVLGDSKPRRLDIRVIATTNRNLAEMVAQGRFREDLFYRINLDFGAPARSARASPEYSAPTQHFLNQLRATYQRPALRVSTRRPVLAARATATRQYPRAQKPGGLMPCGARA